MDEVKVGIDLGTTNCAVAAIGEDGRPYVVVNSDGGRTTPSVVGVEGGAVEVGEGAKDLQAIGSADVAAFFKRHMGETGWHCELDGRTYDATELSALLLRRLVADAEAQLGARIARAVVTVPAYFKSREREAVYAACREAGLSVQGLLSEPSAAAYAYGLSEEETGKTLLVYDFGGGTFDVTVARVGADEIRVIGCDGDHRLGGKDFDDVLARLLLERLCAACGADPKDVRLFAGEQAALAVQAEQVKRQLSSRENVSVPLRLAGMSTTVEMSRIDFECASAHIVRRTMAVVDRLMRELGLACADIDAVVPVGGTTRMPMVLDALTSKFNRAPCGGVNPDEAVALGAAIRANLPPRCLLGGEGEARDLRVSGSAPARELVLQGAKRLVDATAHALGMVAESPDRTRYINSEIIPRNTAIPVSEGRTYALRVPAAGGELEVYMLQGSADRVLDNDVCGKYLVRGIAPEADGESLIEVEYRYNEDAIVEVEARQLRTGTPLVVERVPLESDLTRFDGVPPKLGVRAGGRGGSASNSVIYLVFDVSGSMCGYPLDKARHAMCSFIDEFPDQSALIGVVFFADRCKVVLEPTTDYRRVVDAINAARGNAFDLGFGNFANPLGYCMSPEFAKQGAPRVLGGGVGEREGGLMGLAKRALFGELALNRAYDLDDPYVCLVVLTDGVWAHQDRAKRSANELAACGVDVVAVGFGDADEDFLRDIATKDGYAALVSANALQETFTKIGRALAAGEEPRAA